MINDPTETQAGKFRLQHCLPSLKFLAKRALWGAAKCILKLNETQKIVIDYIQYQPHSITGYTEISGKFHCPLAALVRVCNNSVYNVHDSFKRMPQIFGTAP